MQLIRKITHSDFEGGTPEYMCTVTRYGSRGVLIDDEMNVAMMHLSKNDLYKLPGGGINEGENIREAFLREIQEETGYEAEIIYELGYIEEHKNRNDFMQFSYCFIAIVTSKATPSHLNLTENEMQLCMSVKWMTFDKALEVIIYSASSCNDYSTKFMLLREQSILEKAVGCLRLKM
ncbi:NUDIX hydrolase [Paenibacillus sp. 598K]|uniref:NUDIX hydrolase n=1 Tax=Paenibacillus sp. 598K TaxID=1117987 RepID=UPI000FFA8B1B|nr:NUDIX domain-containing protein [Paenibacillus sp. 598K]GBF75001.1 NUDIX hydrolase [Paenibacillus sp. 598K]